MLLFASDAILGKINIPVIKAVIAKSDYIGENGYYAPLWIPLSNLDTMRLSFDSFEDCAPVYMGSLQSTDQVLLNILVYVKVS